LPASERTDLQEVGVDLLFRDPDYLVDGDGHVWMVDIPIVRSLRDRG
jgi:hypothetical protein